jgi:hypothetical protein
VAFEPSERSRRKLTAQVVELPEPGTGVRGVFLGRAHARLTTPVAVLLGLFGAAFTVALAFDVVLIPGALLLILVLDWVRPKRVVVVAEQGIALLARSQLTGRPARVLAKLPLHVLPPPSVLTSRADPVAFGPDRVTFSKPERERLARSAAMVSTAR